MTKKWNLTGFKISFHSINNILFENCFPTSKSHWATSCRRQSLRGGLELILEEEITLPAFMLKAAILTDLLSWDEMG